MARKSTQQINVQLINHLYSEILGACLQHKLKREDFYFLNDNKKEKRKDPVMASELLLKKTYFKNIRICLHTKTSYMYHPKGIYGPLTDNQIKWLLTRVIEKVEVQELIKPYSIDQIFKALKNSSQVAVSGAILLLEG